MLSIIVSKSKNNMIGKDGKLLWQLPQDLQRFKDRTRGHVIIMGRKTFEAIGGGLPNRLNIVFTNNMDYKVDDDNVRLVHSMLEIQEYIENDDENFVIGGAMIYSLLMPYVKKMYVTQIYETFDGDALFPIIKEDEWTITKREGKDVIPGTQIEYEYLEYERKE